jgi:hypothetical protein
VRQTYFSQGLCFLDYLPVVFVIGVHQIDFSVPQPAI